MKIIYFLPILLCISLQSMAQISSLDTVQINTNASYNASVLASTYNWIFDNANINYTVQTPVAAITGLPLSVSAFSAMVNDNGNWYCFTTNYAGDILRFNYGTDPTGSPIGNTDFNTLGFSSNVLEGMDIVKDAGKWYVFAVNDQQLLRMSFGSTLSGTPTDTIINLGSSLNGPHQLSIQKFGNEWIGFVANRNDKLVRLDFGPSLTNVPVATQIPFTGSYANACNFALHNEAGNWYMILTNLTNNNISRLNFGSNIKNNTPTGLLLGSYGGSFNTVRGVSFVEGCNQLVAYVSNESGSIVKLDFKGSILNKPDSSRINLDTSNFNQVNSMYPFTYHDTLYYLFTSYGSKLFRMPFLKLASPDTTAYYSSTVSHTFTTLGLHTITLYCDQGGAMGASAFCKSVYVRPPLAVNNISAGNEEIKTYPNPAIDEWFVSMSVREKNGTLCLYSLDGKLMQTVNLQPGLNKLNIGYLNAGAYFYRITGEQNVYTGKLLKQ